jgi:hypothetical protein
LECTGGCRATGLNRHSHKRESTSIRVPCHATPRHATPRHATPRRAVPCHAVPCHVMPCHVMPCHVMPCLAVPCRAVPCCAMSCRTMPCRAVPCRGLPWHAMPCHAMPCRDMACHGMPRGTTRRSTPSRTAVYSQCCSRMRAHSARQKGPQACPSEEPLSAARVLTAPCALPWAAAFAAIAVPAAAAAVYVRGTEAPARQAALCRSRDGLRHYRRATDYHAAAK